MNNVDREILELSKKLWKTKDELRFIRRVANYIYYAPESKVYFRLTEYWHRSIEQVNSELNWMFYLKSKGIDFAHPIKSENDNYCEVVSKGHEKYVVSVFKEARGARILEKESFTEEALSNWGEVIGKMHKFTKDYSPSHVEKRPDWDNEEYHKDILNLAHPDHGKIFDEHKRLEKVFSNLPKNKNCYGLIHADLHTGNFHIDENSQIIAFDFDDAIYSWFIYDIVVFLWDIEKFDLDWGFVQESIFKGYLKHNQIDEYWIQQMPDFYNYRVILIHYYCMKSLSDPNLDQTSRDWMSKKVKGSRDFFELEKAYPFN